MLIKRNSAIRKKKNMHRIIVNMKTIRPQIAQKCIITLIVYQEIYIISAQYGVYKL